ncbi:MAG: class I SAM-dependent methyltransferase [Dehalococcoidia bacterium]
MNVARDPYERIARFYDLGHADFDADIDLYEQLARRGDSPVLEAGAGTGRVAMALALRGIKVVGIDASAAMLQRARAKAGSAGLIVDFIETDMRGPALTAHYGLIVCAIDTFLHLLTADDQLQALTAWRELLAPAGLIAIDLPGPAGDWGDWDPGARPAVLDWTIEADGRRMSRYSTFRADLAGQMRHMIDVYEELDPDGAVRRQIAEYDLRFVFPAEAELLLRLAGLRLYARYGDYDLAPFDVDSQRMILIAERGKTLPGRSIV